MLYIILLYLLVGLIAGRKATQLATDTPWFLQSIKICRKHAIGWEYCPCKSPTDNYGTIISQEGIAWDWGSRIIWTYAFMAGLVTMLSWPFVLILKFFTWKRPVTKYELQNLNTRVLALEHANSILAKEIEEI